MAIAVRYWPGSVVRDTPAMTVISLLRMVVIAVALVLGGCAAVLGPPPITETADQVFAWDNRSGANWVMTVDDALTGPMAFLVPTCDEFRSGRNSISMPAKPPFEVAFGPTDITDELKVQDAIGTLLSLPVVIDSDAPPPRGALGWLVLISPDGELRVEPLNEEQRMGETC